MQIQKGDLLNIQHSSKGFFKAVATQDFDTEVCDYEEWYPVVLAPGQHVKGVTRDWVSGEEIPCRKAHVSMILIEEKLGVASMIVLRNNRVRKRVRYLENL